MPDIKFKIVEHLGVLSTTKAGWTKEVNLISWNDGEPKYDVRQWDPDHVKMGKGVGLTLEEAQALQKLLKEKLPNG